MNAEQEIARANVLRMRGDYDGAREILRSVLAEYPENVLARELMGDIFANHLGDLKTGLVWYELAQNTNQPVPSLTTKIERCRGQLNDHQSSETISKLGIAAPGPQRAVIGLTIALVVLSITAMAIWFTRPTETKPAQSTPFSDPIELNPPPPATVEEKKEEPAKDPPKPSLETNYDGTEVEQKVRAGLVAAGTKPLVVTFDPRGQGDLTLTISVTASEAEGFETKAQQIAATALGLESRYQNLTIRFVEGNQLLFVADFSRPGEGASPEPSNIYDRPPAEKN